MSKSTHATTLVLALVALIVIASVSWLYYRSQISAPATTITVTQTQLTVTAEATVTTAGDITTYHFSDSDYMNVMPSSYQAMVLNETPVQQRQAITVAGWPAERLTITSAKDGSELTVVHLLIDDRLYDFRGSENFLARLNDYVTI
ncbi:MAG: hypothetical protein HYV33_01525 [Candidatus Kerfeldbacteria bacterium]|nr:hypothetical protein [Candidatus Kerfeldbacteria bacterium]